MGSSSTIRRDAGDLLESGNEPEFFVTHLHKAEPAANGCLRLYFAQRRGNHSVLLYTVVVAISDLAHIARTNLHNAADAHNLAIWAETGNGVN